MTRTQIQLPDDLYRRAKELAADREISLAELVRNGLEYMLSALTPPGTVPSSHALPVIGAAPKDEPTYQWRPASPAEGRAAEARSGGPKKKGVRA